MLGEEVADGREVRWAWGMRQSLVTRWAGWLCHMRSHIVVEENWALSGGQVSVVDEAEPHILMRRLVVSHAVHVVVEENGALSSDQCWLQVRQFSVCLFDLLSMLLRCDRFAGIQKAVVDQTSSGPPDSDQDLFWSGLTLGSALELLLSPATELVVSGCRIKSSCCCTSQSDWEMFCCCYRREHDTSTVLSFDIWSAHEKSTYQAFSPVQLASKAEWPLVSVEFFSNFLCDRRGSTSATALSWLLSNSSGWPLYPSSSRLSSPSQNFLNTPCNVHSLVISRPDVLLLF